MAQRSTTNAGCGSLRASLCSWGGVAQTRGFPTGAPRYSPKCAAKFPKRVRLCWHYAADIGTTSVTFRLTVPKIPFLLVTDSFSRKVWGAAAQEGTDNCFEVVPCAFIWNKQLEQTVWKNYSQNHVAVDSSDQHATTELTVLFQVLCVIFTSLHDFFPRWEWLRHCRIEIYAEVYVWIALVLSLHFNPADINFCSLLKPYIRRDFENKPPKLKLLEEIVSRANRWLDAVRWASLVDWMRPWQTLSARRRQGLADCRVRRTFLRVLQHCPNCFDLLHCFGRTDPVPETLAIVIADCCVFTSQFLHCCWTRDGSTVASLFSFKDTILATPCGVATAWCAPVYHRSCFIIYAALFHISVEIRNAVQCIGRTGWLYADFVVFPHFRSKSKNLLYASDRQTFVMMSQTTLSVVINGPYVFLKAHFETSVVFSYLLHNNAISMS